MRRELLDERVMFRLLHLGYGDEGRTAKAAQTQPAVGEGLTFLPN